MTTVSYDERKLKELVLYVADKSVEDANFGATKLNKILFFADFLAYANLGHAITGATYQKLEHGPAPRQLLPVQRRLIDDGEAAITPRLTYGSYRQKRLTTLRRPDLSVFDAEEIALVDEVLDQLIHHNARGVSDLSHRWALGWELASIGDEIPYSTVFWAASDLTDADVERGQELAREHGWMVR